jgi:hypothetical protein
VVAEPEADVVGGGDLPDAELRTGQPASGEHRIADREQREQPEPAAGRDDVGSGRRRVQHPDRHQQADQDADPRVRGGDELR